MKKTILFLFSLAMVSAISAQPGKTPVKPAAPVMKNITDSVSYAIGLSVANFYKQQGIKTFNSSLVTRAINDVIGNKKPLFDETVANNVMNQYMGMLQGQKSKPRIDSCNAFCAKNKLRSEVKTTASGLQYEVMVQGNGEKPGPKDSVTCHYKGSLLNGTVFDNSYDRGEPITFALNGVIPGWTEGLQLMTVGSKYKFYIPYNLGYGALDYGPIPGGSLLIFEVELLKVAKGQ
ncbi:MAG: FKBP-type peptidyl-prolyl cis-trans isomerase [Chitinophagaceae bacterium]